ncbi:hypothetical protein OCU04_011683 [Sclerotinia nivalis]|uniref:Uncharacterized protein n=1 Tax=Sclerotinia nivalis TaxID=352851 RepID=A0A9X0AFR0_9HELO|nr:hypothetical protein OCU04_011683 [Sclerotinia nivalis]
MARTAGERDNRDNKHRDERRVTSGMGGTSGRNSEKDDYYKEMRRREEKEKPTSSSSGRRTGSSRTVDVKPIPKPKHQQTFQEWLEKEARRRAGGAKDLIDSCADDIIYEQDRNKLKGRPLWNWTGQEIKDWCKRESAGDPNLERKLWDRYR